MGSKGGKQAVVGRFRVDLSCAFKRYFGFIVLSCYCRTFLIDTFRLDSTSQFVLYFYIHAYPKFCAL